MLFLDLLLKNQEAAEITASYSTVIDPGHDHDLSTGSLTGNAENHDHSAYSADHPHETTGRTTGNNSNAGNTDNITNDGLISETVNTTWTTLRSWNANSDHRLGQFVHLTYKISSGAPKNVFFRIRAALASPATTIYFPVNDVNDNYQLNTFASSNNDDTSMLIFCNGDLHTFSFYLEAKVATGTIDLDGYITSYALSAHTHDIASVLYGAVSADAGVSAQPVAPNLTSAGISGDASTSSTNITG